jgi:general secretion pathway protein L
MLLELLHWWARQMRARLPTALIPSPDDRQAPVLASLEPGPGGGGTLALRLRRGRGEVELGRYDLETSEAGGDLRAVIGKPGRKRCAVLRLPASMLLERDLTLPLAAMSDLGRLLGYEMDRLTPFAVDQVAWTYVAIARDRVRDRVTVRLSIVPHISIAAALAWLERFGTPAASLQVVRSDGIRRIRLDHTPSARERWERRAVAVSAALCVCLALAVGGVALWRQSAALAEVDAEIARLQPRVDRVDALRRQTAEAATRTDTIAAQRARSGDVLATLAALTDILPDDTFVTELSLNERKLAISGQSAQAAKLIPLLAADPAIRNPSFIAAVTRNEMLHRDMFTLQAEIAP